MKPLLVASGLALVLGGSAAAEDPAIGLTPDQMTFGDAGGLREAAVVAGDPSRDGQYVVRLRVPPNSTTMPHTHAQAESVTVISGAIGFGLGGVFDRSKGRILPAGSFLYLPANMPHFAWTGEAGAVIQAHGTGPFP